MEFLNKMVGDGQGEAFLPVKEAHLSSHGNINTNTDPWNDPPEGVRGSLHQRLSGAVKYLTFIHR